MRIGIIALGLWLLAACASGATGSEPATSSPASDPSAKVSDPTAPAQPAAAAADEEAPLPDGKYRITLTRRDRVGARARVRTVTNEIRNTIKIEAGRPKDRQRAARRIELQAVLETLEIDAQGRATKTRYLVERLQAEGRTKPLVAKGTTLTVVRALGGKGTISSSAGPLAEDTLAAIEAVVSTTLARTTEQQVFGSSEPRSVGDSWPVDASAARAVLEEAGIVVRGEVTGSTRVVEKKQEGGEDCLVVLGRLEVSRFDAAGLPDGARSERGKLRMQFSGSYPLAADRPARRQHVQITTELSAITENQGKKLELKLDSHKETTSEIEPL